VTRLRGGGLRRGPLPPLLLLLWLLLASLPLLALLSRVEAGEALGALGRVLAQERTRRALGFGLLQAGGSALVALLFGLPGAWFVSHYRFPGRRLLVSLAALPFSFPPVLMALGFVIWFGRGGLLNAALQGIFSLDEAPLRLLYTTGGLCLAQGLYNFPLVLDLVGGAWKRLPARTTEAARSLGAGRTRAFLGISLPALAPSLVEATSYAFLFSFFSFVVVLVLGPPGLSNAETEIWRLLRLEGNLEAAAGLALAQSATALALLGLLSLASLGLARNSRVSGEGRALMSPRGAALPVLVGYALVLALAFLGPLVSVLLGSFAGRRSLAATALPSLAAWGSLVSGASLPRALASTLLTALPSALLATLLGLLLGGLLRHRRGILDALANFPLAVSAVVTAAGWRLLFPEGGIVVLILIQALTAAPFAIRSSASALASLAEEPRLAARSLGAGPLRAFFGVELRSILPLTLSSAAFAFALSAGDATTPLVLGIPDFEPLPLLVYRLIGAYRYPEACAAGLVLALISGLAFVAKEGRGGTKEEDVRGA